MRKIAPIVMLVVLAGLTGCRTATIHNVSSALTAPPGVRLTLPDVSGRSTAGTELGWVMREVRPGEMTGTDAAQACGRGGGPLRPDLQHRLQGQPGLNRNGDRSTATTTSGSTTSSSTSSARSRARWRLQLSREEAPTLALASSVARRFGSRRCLAGAGRRNCARRPRRRRRQRAVGRANAGGESLARQRRDLVVGKASSGFARPGPLSAIVTRVVIAPLDHPCSPTRLPLTSRRVRRYASAP